MLKKSALLLLLLMLFSAMFSQISYADINKNDMRAVWVSTIFNLDYPSAFNNEKLQKEEFTSMLDELQAIGINTVIVQVRPKADAFYESSINPWSESLTGTQGKDPGYDPMYFMIEEAHKRGMSFHAWLNPYRVTTNSTDLTTLSVNHPARQNPEWVIEHKGSLYYNPDLVSVKKHIVLTVSEIVSNYQVDGIHFDDYFYPSNYLLPNSESKDGPVAEYRRDNVSDMVKLVHNTIKDINPNVTFGISPMGIWKNKSSDPTGSDTKGSEAYYSVFSDCRSWINAGTIDYIAPQIYWEIGYEIADYETLVKWWSNEVKDSNVTLYIGQAAYRDKVAEQITQQLEINQKYSNIKGSIFFRASDILNNRNGIKESLKSFYSLKNAKGIPSYHKVMINGKIQEFDAYNINGFNYFKLRDIAYVLSGTKIQFNTSWDPIRETINLETKKIYLPVGGEMNIGNRQEHNATMATATLKANDSLTYASAYNINGNNYYRIRDIGRIVEFDVDWDPEKELIIVGTRVVD